jgi:hypothetical protein
MSSSVVVQEKTANLNNSSVPVVDGYITYLAYTAIVIVPDRNVFNLNHRTEIIVLNVRVVVVAGIEGYINKPIADGSVATPSI